MKVRTEARKLAIIAAATELFKEFGYERASMNELAKRLGGSKATLYGYFPSKEDLFRAVVRSSATPYLAEATRELAIEPTSRAVLEKTLQSFAEKLLGVVANDASAMAVYRMVVGEAGRSDVGQLFREAGPRESMEALSNWLDKAIERGLLRAGDARVFASQFTALVTAEISTRHIERNPPAVSHATIRLMAKRALDLFLHGAKRQ